MARKTKVLFILFLLFSLTVEMYSYQNVKEGSIRELYEDVTFMRIATEARQYISQIEYGIENGRQLDNFYNMQETLKGVQGCSSYMEGAYVVSTDAKLLYQRGVKAEQLNLAVPRDQTYFQEKPYTFSEDGMYLYLTTPIKNGSQEIEGYLLMCIDQNAVNNAASDYNRQNRLQSLIIALEVFGIALLVIWRIPSGKKKQQAFRITLVISLAVVLATVLDSSLVCARFYQIVNDTTSQTANKMAQALQSQVDSVVAKGVSTERIYDLNGWLAQNSSKLEIVTSLTLDRNNKITANVSQSYINGFLHRLLFRSALFIFVTMLYGLVACGLVVRFYKPGSGQKF